MDGITKLPSEERLKTLDAIDNCNVMLLASSFTSIAIGNIIKMNKKK